MFWCIFTYLFSLLNAQDPSTQRTLTLLSKTVQSVGNQVSSRTSHQNFRESYMREVFAHLITDKHVEQTRTVSPLRSDYQNCL